MPRKRNPIPSYLYHNQTGRARAVWSDQTGRRRFQVLPGITTAPSPGPRLRPFYSLSKPSLIGSIL
jgi:hypothetical protein